MILDLGKWPNQKMHESESSIFSQLSEIISKSSVLIKSYIMTVLIFLWSVLVCLIRIKKKIWIFYFNFKNGFCQCRGLFSHLYIKYPIYTPRVTQATPGLLDTIFLKVFKKFNLYIDYKGLERNLLDFFEVQSSVRHNT